MSGLRRISRIVHDDRGNASVEWIDAPDDFERPKFEVKEPAAKKTDTRIRHGIPVLTVESTRENYDPYDSSPYRRKKAKARKRDLRKLSEWIQLVRRIRRRHESDDE